MPVEMHGHKGTSRPVDSAAARSQLEHMLGSPSFVAAKGASRFLQYVVEESLAGRADQIKEYTIGLLVFQRGDRFDPRIDGVVRVEATRLRSRLRDYYRRYGQSDEVLIDVPTGSYVPTFRSRGSANAHSGHRGAIESGLRRLLKWILPSPEHTNLTGSLLRYLPSKPGGTGGNPRRWFEAATFVAAVALAGYLYVIWRPAARNDPRSGTNLNEEASLGVTLRVTPLTTFPGPEWPGSWSPNGNFVAIHRRYQGGFDLFVVARSGGEPLRITDSSADDLFPRWSPDGRWLAYLSNEGSVENVYLISPSGRRRKMLVTTNIPAAQRFNEARNALGSNPWSPNGNELLFSRLESEGQISLCSTKLDTGDTTRVTIPSSGYDDIEGAWSPNGKSIVFARTYLKKNSGLWFVPEKGGKPRPLLVDEFEQTEPAWTPDNKRVVFASNRGGATNLWEIDVSSQRLRQITFGPGADRGPILSWQGELTFTHLIQQTDLYLRHFATSTETRLTSHTHRNYNPRVSPDSGRIVYQSDRTGNFDIWMHDLKTGKETRITEDPADDQAPDWSPDGDQISFVSSRKGRRGVWIKRVDGGPETPLPDTFVPAGDTTGNGVLPSPRWSPDGKFIGCVGPSERGSALWLIDTETMMAKPVLFGVADFDWYRDSRRVIYTPVDRENGTSRLVKVVDLKTKSTRNLIDQPHAELAAARDGSGLTFVGGANHSRQLLWRLRLQGPIDGTQLPLPLGAPQQLTDGGEVWHPHNGGWSPDGQSIVYMRDTVFADIYQIDGYR